MGATRIAICVALVVADTEARASECAPPSPECHLEHGLQLLGSDPEGASEELLASYKLDERTDTLALYATALQKAGRYALALETWKRIIVFREGELGAAKTAARRSTGRKQAAAKSAVARIQKQSETASEAIIKLWPRVGRVRIQFAPGHELPVWRGGVEVDASRDVIVNAGRDELVFAWQDGSTQKVVVRVAAGASTTIDAPAARKPVRKPEPNRIEQPKATQPEIKPKPEPAPEPEITAPLVTVQLFDEPRSRTTSRVGMALVGGAIIAGGVAGGLGYLADRDLERSRDAGCNAAGQCPFGPAADLARRSNDRARLAQITAIGGGALLATGVTMWIIGRSRGNQSRAANDVTVHVSHSSAAVGWRF